MAITKVGSINTIPTTTDDWTNTVKHINAFINQVNNQAFILSDPLGTSKPTIKQGTYINHGGTLYVVDTEDYTPSGTPADGNIYIKLSPSSDTLIGSFITDISSYSYSQIYGNMISGSDMILPYLLVKSGESWTKYRYDVISPIYKMNQNLRTTDNVQFADLKVNGIDYKGSKGSTSDIITIIDTGTTLKLATGESIRVSLVMPRGSYTCQLIINTTGENGNVTISNYYYTTQSGQIYFTDHNTIKPPNTVLTRNETMDASDEGFCRLYFYAIAGSEVSNATVRLVITGKTPPAEDKLGNLLFQLGLHYKIYSHGGHLA